MALQVKNQKVRISRIGHNNDINKLIDEIQGAHVITYKPVGSQEFSEQLITDIALVFGLNLSGRKTFGMLLWMIQSLSNNQNLVELNKAAWRNFLDSHKKEELALSLPTFSRGLVELEKAKIIAKHLRKGWYFINPNFIFKDDRVAFTTVIHKK